MKSLIRGCVAVLVLEFIAVVGGGVLAYQTRNDWLPSLGQALYVTPKLQRADVIVVLGGGDGDRPRYAAELYHRGLADHLITTGAPAGSDTGALELTAQGVPRNAILLANGTQSTRQDAELTRQLILAHRWKRVILVTDPYHIRRALWTFRTEFGDTAVQISPAPVVGGWFDANHWWQSENGFVVVNDEYLKLIYYIARGYITPSVMLRS